MEHLRTRPSWINANWFFVLSRGRVGEDRNNLPIGYASTSAVPGDHRKITGTREYSTKKCIYIFSRAITLQKPGPWVTGTTRAEESLLMISVAQQEGTT